MVRFRVRVRVRVRVRIWDMVRVRVMESVSVRVSVWASVRGTWGGGHECGSSARRDHEVRAMGLQGP